MPKQSTEPKQLAEGDVVRIVSREAVAADTKSLLFYPHYQGLIGTLSKIYADDTATVTIDPASLPAEIRARHQAGTGAMRQKWLDGLSEESRNKLSAAEKKFDLRYIILVAVSDLIAETSADLVPEPPRKSLADLEAEEERHLNEVAQKRKDT